MTAIPGELYEIVDREYGIVRVWAGMWNDPDDDARICDLQVGESFMIVGYGEYDDTWVLCARGVGVIEGVSDLLRKNVVRLSRACEGSGVMP
jgi:hypothetical protein